MGRFFSRSRRRVGHLPVLVLSLYPAMVPRSLLLPCCLAVFMLPICAGLSVLQSKGQKGAAAKDMYQEALRGAARGENDLSVKPEKKKKKKLQESHEGEGASDESENEVGSNEAKKGTTTRDAFLPVGDDGVLKFYSGLKEPEKKRTTPRDAFLPVGDDGVLKLYSGLKEPEKKATTTLDAFLPVGDDGVRKFHQGLNQVSARSQSRAAQGLAPLLGGNH